MHISVTVCYLCRRLLLLWEPRRNNMVLVTNTQTHNSWIPVYVCMQWFTSSRDSSFREGAAVRGAEARHCLLSVWRTLTEGESVTGDKLTVSHRAASKQSLALPFSLFSRHAHAIPEDTERLVTCPDKFPTRFSTPWGWDSSLSWTLFRH